MKLNRISILSLILIYFTALNAYSAADYPCPEDYVWKCKGGINGVECWCQKEGPGQTYGRDIVSVQRALSPNGGLNIALIADLPPESMCRIDYKITIFHLDGDPPEIVKEGSLSAASPTLVVDRRSSKFGQIIVDTTSTGQMCTVEEMSSYVMSIVNYDLSTENVFNHSKSYATITWPRKDDPKEECLADVIPPYFFPPGTAESAISRCPGDFSSISQ